MGQDFVARKQAKKQRKRQARDAETGRKSKKRRQADKDGFDVTGDDDGLSLPGGEAGQKRQRKKGGGVPLRISRSLCYKPPQLTEADLRGGWGGSDDDDGDYDGVGGGGGRLGGLKQSGYDSDVEEQLQQLPPAQLKQQAQKQQQKPKQPKPKLSTGIRLLDPVKAAQEASSRAQQHQQQQQQQQQLDEAVAASPALRELQQQGNVPPLLLRCMARLGFTEPTPIQAACWPAACAGRDLRGVAEPGSGKTLAYVLPALVQLPATPAAEAAVGGGGGGAAAVAPEALVLVPSRELALQVAAQSSALFGVTGAGAAVVHGGVDRRQQAARLAARPPRLLVATPGRLLDLVDGGEISLGRVACVVLDEADKMLSVGFEPQLQRLKAMLLDGKGAAGAPAAPAGERPPQGKEKKKKRRKEEAAAAAEEGGGGGSRPQVLLFTATMPAAVAATAAAWLQPGAEAVHCGAGADSISRTITQVVHVCAEHKKPAKLLKHLASIKEASGGLRNPPRLLVFANKIKTVLFVHRTLVAEGFRAALLHGKRSQAERTAAVADFKAGKAQVLVASDVASRGLDITGLPFVVNYDFPPSLETYVHRVGRTGRLAASGHAFSFFTRPLAKLAGPLVELLQQHGQAVDPNLLALAQAWQQIEAALAAQGKSAEEAATAAAEAGGSDEEEEEEQDGEGAAAAGGGRNNATAAAAVPEDLQEGLSAAGNGAGSSKKQRQQPGQHDAAAVAAAEKPGSQQQAKKKKARLAGDMLMVPVAASAAAAADGSGSGGISAPAEQFTPAARFSGARLGWAFKKGPRGLGYYWDAPSAAAAAARGQQLHGQLQAAAKQQAKQPKQQQQQQPAAGKAKAKSKPAAALPLLPGLARRQAAARRAAAASDSSDDAANDVSDSDDNADTSGGRLGGTRAVGSDDDGSSSDDEGGQPAGLGQRLESKGRKKALPGRLRRKLAKHKAQAAAAQQGAGGGKGRPHGGGSVGTALAGRQA